ncbi:chorismate--pyruvate lyase family protein [Methanococcus voltae]|uniref:Chorismate-pyruvate lyase n=2 Tax=Methanococcus voltae TaxID=2188 RepID=A0A8J7UT06_METVO|nr:chorismate pyruvate-lyase family protein [Methanococcus voltae]MBP2171902.1 chorismate-pyruvate lyase [Methanococcus voltae]MBP2201143.1 chorismate-pyruvate lyase [Methanococcus voltae]MCS3921866.1 chorismate-pyruvate lyase [Methanococcus voltae PS]
MVNIKPYKVISELKEQHGLSDVEKILLGTDGSITNLLEIIFEGKVVVKTVYQEIIDNVNHRAVALYVNEVPLIYATSKTPLINIEDYYIRESVKKDLLSADIPIGKILKIHNLETRREIEKISVSEIPEDAKNLLNPIREELPQRKYYIIHNSKPIMEIDEYFNIEDHLKN